MRQEVGRLPTVRSSVLLRGKLPLSCQRKRCDDLVGHTPTRSKYSIVSFRFHFQAIKPRTHLCWCSEREDKLIAPLTSEGRTTPCIRAPTKSRRSCPRLRTFRAMGCSSGPGFATERTLTTCRANVSSTSCARVVATTPTLGSSGYTRPLSSGSCGQSRARNSGGHRLFRQRAHPQRRVRPLRRHVRQGPQEAHDKLDFFEARFDLAIKRLRLDAQERVWREDNRSDSLDDDFGERRRCGSLRRGADPLDAEIFSDPLFRERALRRD